MAAYACWSDDCDHEDLSVQVEAAKSFEGPIGPFARDGWRVVVPCSKGHQNTFSGSDL